MKKNIELKPCPFCGGNAEIIDDAMGTISRCRCCGAENGNGVYGAEGHKLAVKDWNIRPIEDAQVAEIKRLREALKIYKEALHEGLWKTGLQDSIWEIIEQAEEKAEQILKGGEE